MKKWIVATFIGAGALQAGQALAVVDAQVMGGARTAKVDYKVNDEDRTKDVKSTEIGVAFHLSPGKLPVAFGAFANMNKYDTTEIMQEQFDEELPAGSDAFSDPESSIAGITYGPELMAWVPIPMFKPFLRASYVMGSYDYKNAAKFDLGNVDGDIEQSITYKTSGYDVGVGFIYSPVPLLGIVVEYNIGSEKLTADKGKTKTKSNVGGSSTEAEDKIDMDSLDDEDKSKDLSSGAIRLGLSLSI